MVKRSAEWSVEDVSQVETAAARVKTTFEPFDAWMNDAMATTYSSFHGVCSEDRKRVTGVTYLGSAYRIMADIKRMRKQNRGVFVQIGSALAYRAIPLRSPYYGVKFATRGFADALRTKHVRSMNSRSPSRFGVMLTTPAASIWMFPSSYGTRASTRGSHR